MNDPTIRYALVCDPFDQWTVWDLVSDTPAEGAGGFLMGLSERDAALALSALLDADEPRKVAARTVS